MTHKPYWISIALAIVAPPAFLFAGVVLAALCAATAVLCIPVLLLSRVTVDVDGEWEFTPFWSAEE